MTAATTTMPTGAQAREQQAATFIAIPAGLNILVGLVDYFRMESGIAHTPGVILVIGASVVIALAALVAGRMAPGGLRTTVTVLLLIGILLTGLAGWFLESGLMMLMMGLSLLAWILFIMVAR